jgi:hypothetical protein
MRLPCSLCLSCHVAAVEAAVLGLFPGFYYWVVAEAVVREASEAVVCSVHRPFGWFVAPQQSVPSELEVKNQFDTC